jgi:hypothetical protein
VGQVQKISPSFELSIGTLLSALVFGQHVRGARLRWREEHWMIASSNPLTAKSLVPPFDLEFQSPSGQLFGGTRLVSLRVLRPPSAASIARGCGDAMFEVGRGIVSLAVQVEQLDVRSFPAAPQSQHWADKDLVSV